MLAKTSVAIAALVVMTATSCDGGESAPTKHAARSTTSTTLSPAQIVDNLANCPAFGLSGKSLSELNAGVHGVAERLVPINVSHVQICRYDGNSERLVGMRVFGPPVAGRIELEANSPPQPSGNGLGSCTPAQPVYLVTFIGDRQHVVTLAGCLGVGNGDFLGDANENWLNELQRYTTPRAPTATTTAPRIRVPVT